MRCLEDNSDAWSEVPPENRPDAAFFKASNTPTKSSAGIPSLYILLSFLLQQLYKKMSNPRIILPLAVLKVTSGSWSMLRNEVVRSWKSLLRLSNLFRNTRWYPVFSSSNIAIRGIQPLQFLAILASAMAIGRSGKVLVDGEKKKTRITSTSVEN